MIIKGERPYNREEIDLLKSRKYSIWQHFEKFRKKKNTNNFITNITVYSN